MDTAGKFPKDPIQSLLRAPGHKVDKGLWRIEKRQGNEETLSVLVSQWLQTLVCIFTITFYTWQVIRFLTAGIKCKVSFDRGVINTFRNQINYSLKNKQIGWYPVLAKRMHKVTAVLTWFSPGPAWPFAPRSLQIPVMHTYN